MSRLNRTRNALQWGGCPIEVASLAFFDIETTGLRPDRGARITETVLDRDGVRFNWERDSVNDSTFPSQLPCLFDHLCAGVVVGHNVQFDLRFVAYEADRHGYRGWPRTRGGRPHEGSLVSLLRTAQSTRRRGSDVPAAGQLSREGDPAHRSPAGGSAPSPSSRLSARPRRRRARRAAGKGA